MQKKDLVDVFLLSRPKVLNLGRCCLLQRASLRHKALRAPPAPAPPLFVCFRDNVFFQKCFSITCFYQWLVAAETPPSTFLSLFRFCISEELIFIVQFLFVFKRFWEFFVQEDKFLIIWNNFDSENGTLSFVESFRSVFVPGWSNHSPVFIATFVR